MKKIVWTRHAEERLAQWSSRFSINKEDVKNLISKPSQLIFEDDVIVTQSKLGNGLLRIVFVEIGSTYRILTLYWTNQVKRYWREDSYEG
jgi:hypothetical protein